MRLILCSCPKFPERAALYVRLVEIGHDKAQVTTTPTVSADGDVVKPTQVIFGGKTKRCCHPNAGKPPHPIGSNGVALANT